MLTIFELKNKSFCRCFIRTPFYIKNLVLLIIMLAFLAVVKLVYFGSDGVYIKSITRLLRGLNSDVFTYLNENRSHLRLDPEIQVMKSSVVSTISFMQECLRLNRPCVIKGLAENSTAFKKWGFSDRDNETESDPYAYLIGKIGENEVKVYEEYRPDIPFMNPAFNNFREMSAKRKNYSEFLSGMAKNPLGLTLNADL